MGCPSASNDDDVIYSGSALVTEGDFWTVGPVDSLYV